jgi:hypothetical protein
VTGHVDSGGDDSDDDGEEGDGGENSEAKMLDTVKAPSFSLMITDNEK